VFCSKNQNLTKIMKLNLEIRGKPETRVFEAKIDASGRSRPSSSMTSVACELEWGDGDVLPVEMVVYHENGEPPQGLEKGRIVTVIASGIEASKRQGAKNRVTVKNFVVDLSAGVVPSTKAGNARSA